MLEDNEWQPGRIAPHTNGILYHSYGEDEKTKILNRWKATEGRVVRVKIIDALPRTIERFRDVGCDCEVFGTVHPDDLTSLGFSNFPIRVFCMHMIDTD